MHSRRRCQIKSEEGNYVFDMDVVWKVKSMFQPKTCAEFKYEIYSFIWLFLINSPQIKQMNFQKEEKTFACWLNQNSQQ